MELNDKIIRQYAIDGGIYKLCNVPTPKSGFLFNFDFTGINDEFLILDNYGNEIIDPAIFNRVYGESDFYLAIDKQTGQIYRAVFGDVCVDVCVDEDCVDEYVDLHFTDTDISHFTDTDISVVFICLGRIDQPLMVPLEYMDRLHKLKNKKRPFCMRLNERSAVEFITQDVGYNELEETIVVKLDFGKEYLEISRDCYRTVSNWKCNTNKLKFD